MTDLIHLNWQPVNELLVKPTGETKNRAFLICPVKDHNFEDWMTVVQRLEQLGWAVHYPPLDTNQDDPVGLRICQDNFAAISRANAIFIIWDGISKGCLFDLGMAFALGKRIIWLALPDWGEIDGKNWEKIIRAMQDER